MTRINSRKLKHLLSESMPGTLLTTATLKQKGISPKLAWWYTKSGWLEHIGNGIYKLPNQHMTWTSTVEALQQHTPAHVAGKTALQILGFAHHIPLNQIPPTIQLLTPNNTKAPSWLNRLFRPNPFVLKRHSLFTDDQYSDVVTQKLDGHSIHLSSPERAAIEVCHLTPSIVSFQETAQLIENLPRLRPNVLQTLLETCTSFKAKRLLLLLGEYHQHPWLEKLNLEKIHLGRGKRQIAEGGVYNAKYQLSTPKIAD